MPNREFYCVSGLFIFFFLSFFFHKVTLKQNLTSPEYLPNRLLVVKIFLIVYDYGMDCNISKNLLSVTDEDYLAN